MKQVSNRLTYANVMASIAVFLVLGGATAIAADQLAKNSVGSKQLKKNAVTAAKLKKNAVTTAKIRNNAVTAAKIQDGAVTGAKVNLSSLGTVPSAATAHSANTANSANSANSLAGQTTFAVRLGFGQSQVIATHGAVSFVANCRQEAGSDYAEILFQTSVNGAVAGGEDDFEGGAADYLNVATAPSERQLVYQSETSGTIDVSAEIDEGFVLGPDGKGLVANSEGIVLGLNYGAPGCYIAGVANAIG